MFRILTITSLLILSSCNEKPTEISISAGSPGGLYFKTAEFICKKVREENVKCSIVDSSGSRANLKNLYDSRADFGIVPSHKITKDGIIDAYSDAKKRWGEMLIVDKILYEPLILAMREGISVKKSSDFVGLKVFTSSTTSGRRIFLNRLDPAQSFINFHYATGGDHVYSNDFENRRFKKNIKQMKKDLKYRVDNLCRSEIDAMVLESEYDQKYLKHIVENCKGYVGDLEAFADDTIYKYGYLGVKYSNEFTNGPKTLLGPISYLVTLDSVNSAKVKMVKRIMNTSFQKWIKEELKNKVFSKYEIASKDEKNILKFLPPKS